MRIQYFTLIAFLLSLSACKSNQSSTNAEQTTSEEARTPVTVTSIETTDLTDYVELNATAAYLQSNFIKASATGYLTGVKIKFGQMVHNGQTVFTMQTKEARALGNTINRLDSSFHFSGIIHIKATASGYIQSLDHQVGDYVSDGEQLATLADSKSFGFILNLPVELQRYVSIGKSVQINIPDGTILNGAVSNILPNVDSVSQTQNVLINVASSATIPQNLIAKVRIVKAEKAHATTLAKAAVLTDDSQTNFWVMKLIDSVTAVKVPVEKGMETAEKIEILRPQFSPDDKILLSGNYGLPDTAKVKIMNEAP